MNINEQNARINQLLKRYDEAKTTDAEEAELAEFFRTSTEVPEEWQDYAVLFSTLEAADTLFIDKELDLLPHKNRRNWWWGIGIAASIAIVAGLTFGMIPKYLKSTEPVIVQQTDTVIKEEHPQIVKNLDVPEPLQPDSLIETVTPQVAIPLHVEEEPHEEHIYAGLEMTAVDSALIGRIAGPGIGQPDPCTNRQRTRQHPPRFAVSRRSSLSCQRMVRRPGRRRSGLLRQPVPQRRRFRPRQGRCHGTDPAGCRRGYPYGARQ